MRKTGESIFDMAADTASIPPALFASLLPEARCPARASLKCRCGVAVGIFLAMVAAPVAIDVPAGAIAWHSAYAGNGDGNYGSGQGNGGANGQNPGKSGQNNGGNNGDDNSDPGPDTTYDNSQDVGGGAGEYDEMADSEFTQSMESVNGLALEGPVAGTPAAGLPTISQLFSLGDEATVSPEDELKLISNGWQSE